MTDVLNEKWIDMKIAISVLPHGTIETRKFLKEYAEELGWNFKEDKKGAVDAVGDKIHEQWIEPKGGKLSPKEFGDNYQRIQGYTEAIASAISTNYDSEGNVKFTFTFGFLGDVLHIAKKEDVMMTFNFAEILHYNYPLTKRINLEKVDKDLAITIFQNKTFQEEYDSMDNIRPKLTEYLFNRDKYDRDKKRQERMERWFDIE